MDFERALAGDPMALQSDPAAGASRSREIRPAIRLVRYEVTLRDLQQGGAVLAMGQGAAPARCEAKDPHPACS